MKIKRYVAAAMAAGVLSTVSLATGITALAATGWIQNGNSYVYYIKAGSRPTTATTIWIFPPAL